MKGKIIIDFEDVIFDREYNLYCHIKKRWLEYMVYMKPEHGVKTQEQFKKRKNKSFLFDDARNWTCLKMLNNLLKETYHKDFKWNFKDRSKFLDELINNLVIKHSDVITNITILVPNYAYDVMRENVKNKKIKIKRMNNDDEFRTFLKFNQWDLLVSSNMKIIKEIILDPNKSVIKKEFLMPNSPYTKLSDKEKIVANEKGTMINYF